MFTIHFRTFLVFAKRPNPLAAAPHFPSLALDKH